MRCAWPTSYVRQVATQSLGLELVSSLVRQIRGTLAIGPGPGADFSVTFTPAAGAVPPADQPKASP